LLTATSIDVVALYREQHELLERYFRRRVGEAEIAKDLAAETYLEALHSHHRFEGDTTDAARWLYGIAAHVLGHHFRRSDALQRALDRSPHEIEAADECERVEQRANLESLRMALEPALNRLPEAQRAAIRLRVVDELSYDDLGHQLGIAPELGRARVSRALHALAATLAASGMESWPT
jgi:RNA polymerase sigma-70 factor (ECF subfamily)